MHAKMLYRPKWKADYSRERNAARMGSSGDQACASASRCCASDVQVPFLKQYPQPRAGRQNKLPPRSLLGACAGCCAATTPQPGQRSASFATCCACLLNRALLSQFLSKFQLCLTIGLFRDGASPGLSSLGMYTNRISKSPPRASAP